MTHHALSIHPAVAAVMVITGITFGLCYFASLEYGVSLLSAGNGRLGPLALTLGRIGAAVGFFYLAATLGAAPLLTAFVGFLAARVVVLSARRRDG